MSVLLKSISDGFTRLLEAVMVVCMLVMLVMVFGNVMLRLFLNTGIDLSEEMPRFAFVWMTFLGAIVGMRKRAHLGVDILVQMLPVQYSKELLKKYLPMCLLPISLKRLR